jgi:hypothetical protein
MTDLFGQAGQHSISARADALGGPLKKSSRTRLSGWSSASAS